MANLRDLIPGQEFTVLRNTAQGMRPVLYKVVKTLRGLCECTNVASGATTEFVRNLDVVVQPSYHYLCELQPHTFFRFENSTVQCTFISCDDSFANVFVPKIGTLQVGRYHIVTLGSSDNLS